jgi:hypothetical protein
MKYWGFLLAKLVAAAGVIWAAQLAISLCFARQAIFLDQELDPFTHDLGYTVTMMLFAAFCTGLITWIVRDQRYRCRTCLRKLRMPMATGSWKNMLFLGQPRTEYICVYGHGTLKVPELQLTGETPDWEPHADIWKELESLEANKK